MSKRFVLADDAIRSALTVEGDTRAPDGLAEAIRATIDATPQRRGAWPLAPLAPRVRVLARMSVLAALLLALIAALLIAGTPRPEPPSVSTYGGGPRRDGVMPGPAPADAPAISWGPVSVGPMGAWSPAVTDDVVFNSDARGIVVALDLTTGESRWEVNVGAPLSSGISVADGLVLVGDVDGVVHSFTTADASPRWTYEAGARLSGPPAVLNGIAYLGTLDGQLHAIDLATGRSAWPASVQTAGPVGRSVAAADGLVYVGSAGLTPEAPATLAAYDAASGELRWSQPVQAGSPGSPGVADGLVFTAGGLDTGPEPSRAYAFGALDGRPAWAEPFVSPTGANLYRAAVTGDRLYLVSDDGWAYALDASDGRLLWATAISAGESPNGAWVDGVLIITGGGQDVLALDPLDGTELWRVPVGSAVRAPAIIGGYIVLGTDAGTLLSLGDQESMQPIPSSP